MNLAQKYRKSKEERWCLRLKTVHPDGDTYDGVVTDIKRGLIVLREERDFEFDGLVVLPKKVIKGYRDGRFETCCNAILRNNGQIKRVRSPRWLAACDTVPQIIAALKRQDIWPGIELIVGDGNDAAFYLGPIVRVRKDGFSLRGYDADGTWEGVCDIKYDEVFRIEIDSKYCKYFNAYMQSKDGP